ncbi:MAG: hypothetical protein NC420_00530 [Eubacterium sp.]|nr:hypothetical protein [Eubacterium sp.]
MKIVFLLGSYFPNYSAVSRCMGNIADCMEDEHDITIISMITTSQEARFDKKGKQRIIRVSTKDYRNSLRCQEQASIKRFQCAEYYYKLKRTAQIVIGRDSLDRRKVNVYKEALSQLEEIPDMLIPVCMPFETVIAALDYKKERPECEVKPYLFDMFAANPRLHRFSWNANIKMARNQSLERRMLKESDRILYVSSWKDYLGKNFDNASLHNAVEVEHPLVVRTESWGKYPFDGSRMNLVYTGVVDKSIRNPRKVIDVLGPMGSDAAVHFFSMGNAQEIIENAVSDSVLSHGAVPNTEAHAAMNNADALISIGNFGTAQIPSKIFEYISTGLPIIHFQFQDDDPVGPIIEKYPYSIVIDVNADPAMQRKQIKEFLAQNKGKRVSFDRIQDLYSDATAENAKDVILGAKPLLAESLLYDS